MSAANFFSKQQQEDIRLAIINAEMNTSGEIRVHIEKDCKTNPIERAIFVFNKLKMNKTAERNGVLIYLAVNCRKFAIIGDAGINSVVPENFWEEIKTNMVVEFKKSNFVAGLTYAIEQAGIKLKDFVPRAKNDINELSDDISFDILEEKK